MYILSSEQIGYLVTDTETGKTIYYQTDWEFPKLAELFGNIDIICGCGDTDGTVDCPHKTASEMITAADNWLFDNDGIEDDRAFDDFPEEIWQ